MKKTAALVMALILLLTIAAVPVLAEDSVVITPEKAIKSLEQARKSAKRPAEFPEYKGHFYIDLNADNIPEMAMVYESDFGGTDRAVAFYYCKLHFDFSNGLENSTPLFTGERIWEGPSAYGENGLLGTSIGGSGGTDAYIYRLDDGRYGVGTQSFGGAGDEEKLYSYSGAEFFDSYYGTGEEVWCVRDSVPGEFDFYTMPDPHHTFGDVKNTDYFYDAVVWANKKQITSGTSATTFSPEATCTRGQVVTFLHRMNNRPWVNTANPFTDVQKSDYFADAVLWAVHNNITSGTSATTFSPEATCTSAQVITFIHRAKGCPTSSKMTDAYSGAYYEDAVNWAMASGVLDGTGSFNPEGVATRAEIVTYMYRSVNAVAEDKPVAPAMDDGRYEITIKRDDVQNNAISADMVGYLGITPDMAANLYAGQRINLSEQCEDAPDITVESFEVNGTELIINGEHEFYYSEGIDKFIYSNYDIDPSGGGITYIVGKTPLIPVSQSAEIVDYSSATRRDLNSVAELMSILSDDYSRHAHMEIKDGYITYLEIEYRP